MRRGKRVFIFIICIIAAVIFAIMGITSIKHQSNYTHTEGVITDIQTEYFGDDTEYTVMVAYNVDGTDYESDLGEYSSSMKVGKTIKICYDPENPSNIDSVGAFGVIITFVMAVLCVIGAFASLFRRR